MALRLSAGTLANLPQGVAAPEYDRAALSPGILHVGVGNFHRAHMGVYLDRLFATGRSHDWAIIGAGVRESDAAMRDRLAAQDWLTSVVELDPEGLSARVTGAMVDFLPVEPRAIVVGMADPRIRIVSLTVTEGGYFLDAEGQFDPDHPDIRVDARTPDQPRTVLGVILKALRLRRAAGHMPFTVLSCDNLPGNGAAAHRAVTGLARMTDPALADWVAEAVAFPNSMVDCITPATTQRERDLVRERFGIEDAAPVVCEPFRQWVIEDRFPAGRPPLEQVGVEFIGDIARYELMKLRILNASHASISYAAALLGHRFIHDAMADPDILSWLRALQNREMIPTLPPLDEVAYNDYLETVIARFSNPEIGDTIARNAADGSDRQPKFILPALRDAIAAGKEVSGLALEIALWARYLRGVDEAGQEITIHDPLAQDLRRRAKELEADPLIFLRNIRVFGDLAENPRLAEAFSRWTTRLDEAGVREALKVYAAQTV
ncbi:mannitol dehydrogenase family protein [Nitratireductor luteus]|uniref:mannitol dehydrogenase family protein n=1 Tax=Nitratireductor luteus TaxID=2976980 RepID=UPI00224074C4|nr:mannitol dehydrogenase family protein [Nitratireductor luteus]